MPRVWQESPRSKERARLNHRGCLIEVQRTGARTTAFAITRRGVDILAGYTDTNASCRQLCRLLRTTVDILLEITVASAPLREQAAN
ncbi:MAG TPA: hypothetical protein VKB79_17805 [Bryobacteraceae bacterium]|nr:hypothetical protein [Bryobacteraceae bacterium]